MAGILYGVGVGPGDPELMTLQAVRVIRASDVILAPGREPKETVAWKIAAGAVPELAEKEAVGIHMPMTKDPDILQRAHQEAVDRINAELEKGKKAAFLTLGDPCIYSTYLYVHRKVQAAGYQAEIISGIPSFIAVAAAVGDGLVENSQMLHVIPASYPAEEGMALPGTRVLMKAGKAAAQVRDELILQGAQGWAVERCGMEGERIFHSLDEIPDDLSYYSIIVAKEAGE
ncbi:precorrin-2 C(20)-methyltransferase [Lachnospiraceae bacterium DSM 108991]|uniref:Precorrin-2 C(20)-methyltransferase n=1 Tax=Claveliimonas monacensis TaxID=2779351 RepID=A0ABR9RID4_9FIRM|nr:precorrin-2 C(20)-methyltransferase [Claveliimonas monacensis]MBE5062325.1 precorrin-2 C(20)-methyltransferase [Claveliimonas monacensis]